MFIKPLLSAGIAAALGLNVSIALADDGRRVFKDGERHVAVLDRGRAHARAHGHHVKFHHHVHKWRRKPWHLHHDFYAPAYIAAPAVHVRTVTYAKVVHRTSIDYALFPPFPYAYPPYFHVYSLTPGPIYNKPCLC